MATFATSPTSSPATSAAPHLHPKVDALLASIARGETPSQIDLSNCGLTEIPPEVFALRGAVESLNLGGNQLTDLPDSISQLTNLRILFFAQNNFTSIPLVLGTLPSLYMLSFKSNQIDTIHPASLSPTIGWLILTDNKITQLPPTIGKLLKLRKCMLAGNRLTSLPEEMAHCTDLELLRIAANNLRIRSLPGWLWRLPKLSWLALAGNDETGVRGCASSVDTCSSSGGGGGNVSGSGSGSGSGSDDNKLLRDSGGSGSGSGSGAGIPVVQWSDLVVHEKLGEGASGVIYKASWRRTEAGASNEDAVTGTVTGTTVTATDASADAVTVIHAEAYAEAHTETVAVKLFKGGKTSDGLPEDEMKAAQAAGGHPCSFQVLGRVHGAPDAQQGLVFPLIPPHYTILGLPPSFDTVTRDTYPLGTVFSVPFVLRVLAGVSSVCGHLHSRGISHGDLYAHNILVDGEGGSLLSDYGAASFYPSGGVVGDEWGGSGNWRGGGVQGSLGGGSSGGGVDCGAGSGQGSGDGSGSGSGSDDDLLRCMSVAMEGYEVRAFGCLIEDLVRHIDVDASGSTTSGNSLGGGGVDCSAGSGSGDRSGSSSSDGSSGTGSGTSSGTSSSGDDVSTAQHTPPHDTAGRFAAAVRALNDMKHECMKSDPSQRPRFRHLAERLEAMRNELAN